MGLGKSDVIRTYDSCSALINSIKGSIGEKKKEKRPRTALYVCIIQHLVLLYLLQVFRFRPMLCGFLNLQKAVHIQFFFITYISKNHDNY
jgi:hypothetical protein